MIVCCGEALIDFLPRATAEGDLAFLPLAGGSIFNTAIALGRLGVPAGFFGGLSRDFFGDMLRKGLSEAAVDYSFSQLSDRPSPLAFVKLIDGHARYSFFDEGSAGRLLTQQELPILGPNVSGLHFGSFSLIVEPCGSAYEALLLRECERRVISLDPNIRAAFVTDRASYLARLLRMMARADILKVSDEDAIWLAPGTKIDQAALTWLEGGAKIVVITRGAEGAIGFTRDVEVEVEGTRVEVADTVGAGDTFSAAFMASLYRLGLFSKAAIAAISETDLRFCLTFATRASAITVSRPGADPPWAHELA